MLVNFRKIQNKPTKTQEAHDDKDEVTMEGPSWVTWQRSPTTCKLFFFLIVSFYERCFLRYICHLCFPSWNRLCITWQSRALPTLKIDHISCRCRLAHLWLPPVLCKAGMFSTRYSYLAADHLFLKLRRHAVFLVNHIHFLVEPGKKKQ